MKLISRLGVSLLLTMASATALAQTAAQSEAIRSTANPARAADYATPISQPPPTLEPERIVTSAETLSPEMEKIEFQMVRIRIQDPIIFCEEDLVLPYRHKVGKRVTLKELQSIAKEITTRYQKSGYILTQVIVPAQTIEKGVVTLRVISGTIDKIEIQGIQPCVAALLKQYGEAIQCCVPLHVKTLERYSLLASDIPGINIKVVLKPSKNKVGATDLAFVGCQTLESASLNVNNINSRYLGPTQVLVSGERNSWLHAADQTQAIFVTTGDPKLNYGQFRYSGLINCEGLRYNLIYRYARARPGNTLAQFDVRGTNKVYAGELLFPYIRSREENLFFQTGFTVTDDQVSMLRTLLYNDRIRPVHGSIIYNVLDRLQGVNQFQLTLSHGLKILNASGKTFLSRPTGESGFTKLDWSVSRNQLLPCHFSLYAIVNGQYSFDPLLSLSQFSFGGRDIGRGYDPSELLGDRGITASAELRYDFQYFAFLEEYLDSAQPYAFYDAGKVWNLDPDPSPQRQTATSAGAGIRLKIVHCVTANFYLAKPISKVVRASGHKKVRGFFTLSLAL